MATFLRAGPNTSIGPILDSISLSTLTSIMNEGPAAFGQFVNQQIVAAGNNLPEGEEVELQFSGFPSFVYTPQWFADQTNQQFQTGQLTGTDGLPVTPWTQYPNQVAFIGPNNTVYVRFIKKAFLDIAKWLFYLVLVAVLFLVVYEVLRGLGLIGTSLGNAIVPVVKTVEGVAIGGVLLLGAIGVGIMAWRLELAKAGAPHSTTVVSVGK